MKEVAQNNPILYIFLRGVDLHISTAIQEIQAKRIGTKGVSYMFIDNDAKSEDILKDIELSHNKFIKKKYQYSGEIKVNYVLNADDPFSLKLPQIKRETEYYLKYLYPAGITTDVFAIMDDATALFSEGRRYRNNVMNMLSGLQNDTCLVYILSNVNSECIYDADNNINNIVNSIALIALIKDCVSLNPDAVKNSFYSERYFKEDSLMCGGSFMTIGYANVDKPVQAIYTMLVTKLLVFMDKGGYDAQIEFNLPKLHIKGDMLSMENLAGLPVSHKLTENEKRTLTNKQIIDMLYKDTLDLFFDLNFEPSEEHSIFDRVPYDFSLGFYAVYYITLNDGELMTRLMELLKQNLEARLACENELKLWLKQTGANSRGGSLFKAIDEYPLMLAKEYLEFRHRLCHIEKEGRLIKQAINEVTGLHRSLFQMKVELDTAVSENNKLLTGLKLNRNFYEASLVKYLEDSYDEFFDIYMRMYDFLKRGELHKYIDELKRYIEDNLSKIFKEPVIDEAILMACVNENRMFNVFLKSGGKNLHSETNILMDSNSKLVLNKEKVNLFFENNENQIDILYHVGGFSKEDLYYDELHSHTRDNEKV